MMSSQTQRASERIIHDTRCIEEGLPGSGTNRSRNFAQAADEVGKIPYVCAQMGLIKS